MDNPAVPHASQSAPSEPIPSNVVPISAAAEQSTYGEHPPHGTHRVATLLGFLPEPYVRQLLVTDNLVDAPKTPAEIHQLWESAVQARRRLPTLALPAMAPERPLPAHLAGREDEVKATDMFQRWYAPFAAYRLRLVPARMLVTPQYFADLDYIESIAARLPDPSDDDAIDKVLDLALSDGAPIEDPAVMGNAVIFKSTPNHLRPLQPTEYRRIGTHEMEVVVRIQTAPNFLQVARIGPRLIVANGIHRTAALLRRGWEYIPCLVRDAANLADAGFPPGQPAFFPEPELLVSPRPPYLADYFSDGLSVVFHQRNLGQAVRVVSQLEGFSVPA